MKIVSPRMFGAKGDKTADDTAAIQAAIDYQYVRGGGVVEFGWGRFLVSDTIELPQRVVLQGSTAGFVNQYAETLETHGTVLYLKTGTNKTVVEIVCRLTVDGSDLVEDDVGGINNDVRHFGGMRDITVFGNRAGGSTLPTVKTNNTAGKGIHIKGSRYINLERVVSMFCAEEGVYAGSNNYGTGSIGCNNLQFNQVSALSNAAEGFEIYGGDSVFSNLNAGYNGKAGMTFGIGNSSITGGLSWNNLEYGVSINQPGSYVGIVSYDNHYAGFYVFGGYGITLSGCQARGNGRDTGLAAAFRANYLIGNAVQNCALVGCISNGYDGTSGNITQYGFTIANSTYDVMADGCFSANCAVAEWNVTDETKLRTHNARATGGYHDSVIMSGALDVNGQRLKNTGTLAFNEWFGATPDAGSVVIPLNRSLVTLDVAGGTTITDMTFWGGTECHFVIVRNVNVASVTFTHNANKIRCAGGVDLVLAQYEAVMFVRVEDDLWQQIKG